VTKRQCRGCRAYLRSTQPDIYCDPCQLAAREPIRHRPPKMFLTDRVRRALTDGPQSAATISELLHVPVEQAERTLGHLVRRREAEAEGRRGNQTTGRTRVYRLVEDEAEAAA
jgi:predicted ArsR family transcriptional regulator